MDIVAMLVDAGASWEHDRVDELIATAMSGDRDAIDRLLAADIGLGERAIARCPDQLVRAAEQDSYEAVALLIELGLRVSRKPRPLYECDNEARGGPPAVFVDSGITAMSKSAKSRHGWILHPATDPA